jgi:hypothetical protein
MKRAGFVTVGVSLGMLLGVAPSGAADVAPGQTITKANADLVKEFVSPGVL